jgi:hypothetical protein
LTSALSSFILKAHLNIYLNRKMRLMIFSMSICHIEGERWMSAETGGDIVIGCHHLL